MFCLSSIVLSGIQSVIHFRYLASQDPVSRSHDPWSLKIHQATVTSNLYCYRVHRVSVFCKFSIVDCARTLSVEHECKLQLELGHNIDIVSTLSRRQYFATDLQGIFIPIKRLPSLSCDLCSLTTS